MFINSGRKRLWHSMCARTPARSLSQTEISCLSDMGCWSDYTSISAVITTPLRFAPEYILDARSVAASLSTIGERLAVRADFVAGRLKAVPDYVRFIDNSVAVTSLHGACNWISSIFSFSVHRAAATLETLPLIWQIGKQIFRSMITSYNTYAVCYVISTPFLFVLSSLWDQFANNFISLYHAICI